MNIIIACEYSGRVREEFNKLGANAWSCDLLPSEIPGNHFQDDIRNILRHQYTDHYWDLMIAFPPCTHLSVAGAPSFKYKLEKQKEALRFIRFLLEIPIFQIALENPIGIISTKIRKPDQIVQPYWFGDSYKKSTCLWLKNLPLLIPTNLIKPEFIYYKSKKTKSGYSKYNKYWKLSPNDKERSKKRSLTPPGLAKAMAKQWYNYQPLFNQTIKEQ